jgi:stage V sporulation protein SpoVS
LRQAFKLVLAPGISLMEHDVTDLNVSAASDPNKIANAVICIVKERGQAVMKAGGGNALHVAMSAIINARRRLKRSHKMDLMVSAASLQVV